MRELALYGGGVALVDDADYPRVASMRWYVNNWGYVVCTYWVKGEGRSASISLHRFVMNAPKGTLVDHVKGNKLDCRQEMLRLCTRGQNQKNKARHSKRSQFKGVRSMKGRWEARICVDYKQVSLGCFDSAEVAAKAYDVAAREYHGPFARLNFPDQAVA